MSKKIFSVGVLSLMLASFSSFAAESGPVIQQAPVTDVRFNCAFEGPAVVVKGAVPLVCTAFGGYLQENGSPLSDDGDHLTVICGNSVVYSDGLVVTQPTANTTEIRSMVPGVASITMRSLNPGVFTGPLGSVLRIDIPGTPQALLTGVCHQNFRVLTPAPTASEVETQ